MLKVKGQTIYLTRADSAKLKVIPKVKDEEGEKIPYVLEDGDKVIFRLKKKAEDIYEVICEKECEIDIETNTAILNLVPADTASCDFKEHRYECELVTADDFHCTFIENQAFTIGKELEVHGE